MIKDLKDCPGLFFLFATLSIIFNSSFDISGKGSIVIGSRSPLAIPYATSSGMGLN
jgi:hypothetical protein